MSNPPTETDLLRSRIAREEALVGLINILRDLALDLRDYLRQESGKRRP